MSSSEQPQQEERGGLVGHPQDSSRRYRLLIVLAAVLVCAYAIGVIYYVMASPEIGVVSAFTTVVNHFDEDFLYPTDQVPLRSRDVVVSIGGEQVADWPQMLRRIRRLAREETVYEETTEDPRATINESKSRLLYQERKLVRVEYLRDRSEKPLSVWLTVARPQLDTLVPTVLWFFIKGGLFVVGALVFWKRPGEPQARMFFLFCIGSCAAYAGGYHWQGIVTQPVLLVVFMVAAILLPSISLHFYLLFPRTKPFFGRHPTATLLGLYAPPLLFIAWMMSLYFAIRHLADVGTSPEAYGLLLSWLKLAVYVYFGIAYGLYLLSIWCLVHGYRTAPNALERNQVKWILYGAVAALAMMTYSLYLAVLRPDLFGGGAATWPMFFASVFVTLSFAISITRYRLMELDRLISSGAAYFSINIFGTLLYYILVIVGVLLLGSTIIAETTLAQGLGVAGTVLLLVGVLNLARGRLKNALDRHFRREKGNLDRTFQRMSEAIDQLVDSPALAHRLLRTTSELLGSPRGAVYLRQGDPAVYRLADCVGDPPPLTELSPGSPLVVELHKNGRLRLRPQEGESVPAERQLQHLGGEVALALAHEGRLLALLVLGSRGADAYSDEDLHLLSAFAHVTVLALVSSESGRTIETLKRELQGAVDKVAELQRRIALQSQLLRKEQKGKPPAEAKLEPARNGDAAPPADETETAPGPIIGSGPALRQLMDLVRKVADSSDSVLLRGESGTGKELLARAVHDHSPRAGKPFVKVHCAALSSGLLESELFGHVKGAFTGAVRDRQGRFELADGGTLFLDEIGDVSWEVQTKLLHVIEHKSFERVGSSEVINVDVRIIAATHQNLERLIQQGRFREDLYYRLNVLPVRVPPLRERREDIPELVQHFLNQHANGKPVPQIDDDALALLKAAPWPGNVRQLEHVLTRAVVAAEGPVLTVDDFPAELREPPPGEGPLPVEEVPAALVAERAERERRERDLLVRALAAANGNKTDAARALGIPRSTLLSRLKKYGLS